MSSLTGQTISSTYDGLLKTDDNDILGAAPKEITDGLGNGSGMTLSTTGDVSIAGDLTVDGAILDSNGVPGASGQILSSTVTGTDWVSLSEISGVDGTGTANYIAKWTDGDTIGNSVIYDNGTNVGIGTSSPATPLDVSSVSSTIASFRATGFGANNIRLEIGSGGDRTIFKSFQDTTNVERSIAFQTGNTERMRIDSSGNVGIGTSSPSRKLMVQQTDGLNNIIGVFKTNSPVSGVISFSDVNSTAGDFGVRCGAVGDNFTVFTNGANERMRIDSSGNVQIGAGTRFGKFDILNVGGSGSNFIVGASANGDNYYTSGTSGVQVFRAGASERMRIDSSGNVGIGTGGAIDTKLHILGSDIKLQAQGQGGSTFIFSGGNNTSINSDVNYGNIKSLVTSGVTNAESGVLSFETRNSGTTAERMRITSSGNVGIGTSSPSEKLYIEGSTPNIMISNTAETESGIIFQDSAGGTQVSSIKHNSSNNSLIFSTALQERMRITSGGDVLIGTTTAAATAGILITPNNSAGAATMFFNRNATTSQSYIQDFRNGGVVVGFIAYNNLSVTYASISDYRLKEDWQPMANALDRVEALKPINFAWKSDGSRVDGFLAHELAEVIPEAVTGEKDAVDEEGNPEYQGIDQSKIVPLLTAALQEANQMIKELTTRIEILETK